MRKLRRGILLLSMVGMTVAALAGGPAMATEEPKYEVIAANETYEIRRYAPYLVAEVEVSGSLDESGRKAFRVLADYIFGGNASDTRMSMTAPVESVPLAPEANGMPRLSDTSRGEDGQWIYAFVMERKYSRETLPAPLDKRIRIVERPARTMAVLQFSGTWRENNIGRHEQALIHALEQDGIDALGAPMLARYDAPFMPWFLRRNEIQVQVAPTVATRRY